MIEFDIIFNNMMVFGHFQVINIVFGIGNWVNRTKMGAEGADKCGPVM